MYLACSIVLTANNFGNSRNQIIIFLPTNGYLTIFENYKIKCLFVGTVFEETKATN